MIETKAAFARRLGVHKSQITRAAQAGRVVLTPDGRIDVEASVQRWYATKGGRADVAARHEARRQAVGYMGQQAADHATTAHLGTMPEQLAVEAPVSAGRTRTEYKALALYFENQAIKLEMALHRGSRYPTEMVKSEALGLGATMRAAMERVIDRTAPRLATMGDDLERRRFLETELRRVRRLLKTGLPRALRRMRRAAKKNNSSPA